jgi:hypothetical protein
MEIFTRAKQRMDAKIPPAGVMPREGGPDPRWVTMNESNTAIYEALMLLADRIDRIDQK